MFRGFRDFIMRGNVVDLAVAVVIGAAFGAVITAFVADIITPLIAAIFAPPSRPLREARDNRRRGWHPLT